MDTFADYILNEKNLSSKIEITYYLAKKEKIFFDKSVIFKTELARLFLKYNHLELDDNLILTACLLYGCKKIQNSRNENEIKLYTQNSAEYLRTLGFDKRFCKICEEVNRYSGSMPREKESDVLELVDQFGGMLLDRPERIGFEPDEALVLLEHRNLKDEYNRYAKIFEEFINLLQEINIKDSIEIKALKKLVKLYNEDTDLITFIKNVVEEYETQIDLLLNKKYKNIESQMFNEDNKNKNRAMFTEETTIKLLGDLKKQNINLDDATES